MNFSDASVRDLLRPAVYVAVGDGEIDSERQDEFIASLLAKWHEAGQPSLGAMFRREVRQFSILGRSDCYPPLWCEAA